MHRRVGIRSAFRPGLWPVLVLSGFLSLGVYQECKAKDSNKGADLSVLLSQAEDGSTKAQYRLGMLYFQGKGVDRDMVEARKWLRMAADKGHTLSQNNLGLAIKAMATSQAEHMKAAAWFRLAAEQGMATA